MWNKKIGADQINARLGDISNPRPQQTYTPSEYEVDEPVEPAAFSRHNDYGQESSDAGGAVFYASIAGVFLAVGAATYFLVGGEFKLPSSGPAPAPPTALISSMDQTCGKGWRENVPNVDQMHCYMTKNVMRLCNADEKAHLIATIERYRDGYNVWNGKLMGASIGAIASTNMNALQMGYEEAKSRDERLTEQQRDEHFGKLMDIAGSNMSGTNEVLSEVRNTIPMYKLTEDFAALAKQGLVSPDDFGWSKADFVDSGFASNKEVKAICPPPLRK